MEKEKAYFIRTSQQTFPFSVKKRCHNLQLYRALLDTLRESIYSPAETPRLNGTPIPVHVHSLRQSKGKRTTVTNSISHIPHLL